MAENAPRPLNPLPLVVPIAVYVFSLFALLMSIGAAGTGVSNFAGAITLEMRLATISDFSEAVHQVRTGENLKAQAVKLRADGRGNVTWFVLLGLASLGGLFWASVLVRRSRAGTWFRELPARLGLPSRPPWEPCLGAMVMIVLGLGPLSGLLPEPEGTFELTGVDIEISTTDFHKRFDIQADRGPQLFVVIEHNDIEVLDTRESDNQPEAMKAHLEAQLRIRWKHEDRISFEIRDDDPIGSKVIMRGTYVNSPRFPLNGGSRTAGGSTVRFTSRRVRD